MTPNQEPTTSDPFMREVLAWLARQPGIAGLDEAELETKVDYVMTQVTDAVAERYLVVLDRTARAMLRGRRSDLNGFQKRLCKLWREPLDVLESIIELASEAGASLCGECMKQVPKSREFLLFALAHLHARGCQVSNEILTLLKGGFADGANARWRTLHELNIVAMFLAKHGEEAARRFVTHAKVESYRQSVVYQKHHETLGFEAPDPGELKRIEQDYGDAVAEFGRDFGKEYGWAAPALGKQRPSFRGIEENVQQDHYRPLYKSACVNVHASPKRIGFSLGWVGLNVLPAGPSNMGLADPGMGTAISLSQLTNSLLVQHATIERICTMRALQALVERSKTAFMSVHARLPQYQQEDQGQSPD